MHFSLKKISPLLVALGVALLSLTAIPVLSHAQSTPYWMRPSEKQAYPDVNKHPGMWILVSKKTERTYLIDHGKVLYTMLASTGTKGANATPTGTFQIEAERGISSTTKAVGKGPSTGFPGRTTGSTSSTASRPMPTAISLKAKPTSSARRPLPTVVSACRSPMPSGCIKTSSKEPRS